MQQRPATASVSIPMMTIERELLARFLRENPFQPATGVWRAIEISHVARHGLPAGRGLDLGCGDGRLLGILLAAVGQDGDIVGVDVDPSEARAARSSGHYVRVHAASADAVPEMDASFDWVFSNSTLEHVGPIDATLREVARVLKPGGAFIFTVPSSDFHACLRGPLLGKRSAYVEALDRRCAHLRYWDDDTWRSKLADVGLVLRTTESYLDAAQVRRWELLSNLTSGVLSRVTGQSPIAVQRRLGMRRGQRMPEWMARVAARFLAGGTPKSDSRMYGCRYYVAHRRT